MGQDFLDPRWLRQERRWLRRLRRGDRAALGPLYDAFAPRLYRQVILPRLGDEAAAEDVLAETFVTALERLGQYEDRGSSLWFWLARIAANKATDRQRSGSRAGRALAAYGHLLSGPEVGADEPGARLAEEQERALLQQRLGAALAAIPERYRQALELRFLQGLERPACAERLGVRLGTFDVLLLRSLRALRQAWSQEAGEEGDP